MKKCLSYALLLFSFVALGSTHAIYCQDIGEVKNPKPPDLKPYGYFGAGAGLANPLGIFKSKTYYNRSSGYAMPGTSLYLVNSHYNLSDNFALGGLLMLSAFPFQVDVYLEPYRQYNKSLLFDGLADPYGFFSGAGTLTITVPTKIFDFDTRYELGVARLVRPAVRTGIYSSTTGDYLGIWVQEASPSVNAIFGFGATLRWHAWKKIDLALIGDYQRMDAKFKVAHYFDGVFDQNYNERTNLEFFTVAAGLGLRLF